MAILQENGDVILQENSDAILLELEEALVEIQKTAEYTVGGFATIQLAGVYAVYSSVDYTIEKTILFVVVYQATINLSAEYVVGANDNISKVSQYTVPSENTVNLSAGYCVPVVDEATVNAEYLVATYRDVTKDTVYSVSSLADITKLASYLVEKTALLEKNVLYLVSSTVDITKTASYAVSSSVDYAVQKTAEYLVAVTRDYQTGGSTTIADQYPESNAYSLTEIYNSFNSRAGQSFTGNGQSIKKASFYLKKLGNPTGDIVAKLYSHTGTFGVNGVPQTLLATSAGVEASSLTTNLQWIDFNFNSYTLTNNGKYFIVLEYSKGSSGNRVQISSDTQAPVSHAGNTVLYSFSWTAYSSIDLIFSITTEEPLISGRPSVYQVDSFRDITKSSSYVLAGREYERNIELASSYAVTDFGSILKTSTYAVKTVVSLDKTADYYVSRSLDISKVGDYLVAVHQTDTLGVVYLVLVYRTIVKTASYRVLARYPTPELSEPIVVKAGQSKLVLTVNNRLVINTNHYRMTIGVKNHLIIVTTSKFWKISIQ